MSKCRSCGATIIWVSTQAGKSMPVDGEPTSDGNIGLMAGGMAVVLSATQQMIWEGEKYKSHFATCPNAKQHRKVKT